MMRDERPPRYKGEMVRTAGGSGPSMAEMDRRAAQSFVDRRDWDLGLNVRFKYVGHRR